MRIPYLNKTGLNKLAQTIKAYVNTLYGEDNHTKSIREISTEVYSSFSGEETFTEKVYAKVQEAYRYVNNGYFVFVSNTLQSVKFDNNTYTCYQSISEALSEYSNLPEGKILCVIVLEGTYLDVVITDNNDNTGLKPDVIITGIDKNKCIVINDESKGTGYYYAPFRIMSGNSVLNLTVKCTTNSGASGAYCIHSDTAIKPLPVLIKNCVLVEEQLSAACIGFGTGQKSPLRIENCLMTSKSRCLYGHNAHVVNTTDEDLYVINCTGHSDGESCIYIFDANHFYQNGGNGSSPWKVHIRDCYFVNNQGEAPTELSSELKGSASDTERFFSSGIKRMPDCSGNNSAYLNYGQISKMSKVTDCNDAVPNENLGTATFFAFYETAAVHAENCPTTASTAWMINSYRISPSEVVQVAFASHTNLAFYRRRLSNVWQAWKQISLVS